jgi:hypothetical protein
MSNVASRQELMRLSPRARIALALACARCALDAAAGPGADQETMDVRRRCEAALEDAWAWLQHPSGSAESLYRHIHPLLDCEGQFDLARRPQVRDALFAVVSALYYTAWKADAYAFQHGQEETTLPNDLAEVSERTLIESLDFSAQAADDPATQRRWQQAAIRRLEAEFGTNDPAAWGEVVPRKYFDTVSLT